MKINLQTLNKYQQFKFINLKPSAQTGMVNPFVQNESDSLSLSFTAKDHCTTANFQVKNIPNLHCPACGLVMLTDGQINAFIKDVAPKKGQELVDALTKYEDETVFTNKPSRDRTGFGIYRPIKKAVVEVYKDLAIENPDMTLLALTKLQANRCINELINEQMLVINELINYTTLNFEGEERDDLLNKIAEYTAQIKGEPEKNGKEREPFARKKFIYAMKTAVPYQNKKEVEEIASKMPTSENDINSFFVKYARKAETSKDIAAKFVNQSIPTAEHIKPRALGGRDARSNYICDCADCNSRRGHTPFYEWLQTLPGFEERLQDYMNNVRVAIDNEQLPNEYDTYIEKVIETLALMTEGEVILEIPEVTNPKKNAAVINRREQEVKKLISQNEKLARKRDEYKAQIEELEKYEKFDEIDQYREILDQIKDITDQITQHNSRIIELRKPLYDVKNQLANLEDRIECEKSPDLKEELKQEFDEVEKRHRALEGEVVLLEKAVDGAKLKRVNLSRQKKNFSIKENSLKKRIDELKTLIFKIENYEQKISEFGNISQKEKDLNEKIAACDVELQSLQEKNDEILAKPGFDKTNASVFHKFNHQKDLQRSAEVILKNKEYRKNTSNSGLAREVIEIALKAIKSQIAELEVQDEVVYFINMNSIQSLNTKRTSYSVKLEEALRAKRELEFLNAQIEEIRKNRNIDDIRAEYAELCAQKNMIDRILGIGEIRDKLDYLAKIVKKNDIYLQKLSAYKDLTNEKYSEYKSFIEIDERFLSNY